MFSKMITIKNIVDFLNVSYKITYNDNFTVGLTEYCYGKS